MTEKRSAPRKASLEPCSIELYADGKGPFPSRVVNYSTGGLMIELDHPLTKGEPVKIRFRPETDNAQRLGETYCIGMVRWCAPQEGRYSSRYGVGVQMPQSVRATKAA
ncbi:PilZ domain protein [anaerobic digester metagenome]